MRPRGATRRRRLRESMSRTASSGPLTRRAGAWPSSARARIRASCASAGALPAGSIAEQDVLHLSEDVDVVALLLVLRIENSQPQCRPWSRASAWRARRPFSGATWTALTDCNDWRDPLPALPTPKPAYTARSSRSAHVVAGSRTTRGSRRGKRRRPAETCWHARAEGRYCRKRVGMTCGLGPRRAPCT